MALAAPMAQCNAALASRPAARALNAARAALAPDPALQDHVLLITPLEKAEEPQALYLGTTPH